MDHSILWLVCAEKCLATYLWESDDYPERGQLTIGELAPDELLLARHWSDQRDDSRTVRAENQVGIELMQMIQKRFSSTQPQRPIEFVTENGFSIIRLCDIDKSIPAVGATHEFLVRDPHGYELHITVQISSNPIAEIGRRSRSRISNDNSYWLSFAERHLATYLWENDDYPPDARLEVDDLTLDDIDLARRWDRDI